MPSDEDMKAALGNTTSRVRDHATRVLDTTVLPDKPQLRSALYGLLELIPMQLPSNHYAQGLLRRILVDITVSHVTPEKFKTILRDCDQLVRDGIVGLKAEQSRFILNHIRKVCQTELDNFGDLIGVTSATQSTKLPDADVENIAKFPDLVFAAAAILFSFFHSLKPAKDARSSSSRSDLGVIELI